MTNDKKQPGLPVVEVDQAFPLMTTDGVSRPGTSSGITGDQGPAVAAAIRDVLGWRPRVQDPKAFTAALTASFELSTVEDHVVARYVPRGVAVQADLGGVTGGQASLYLRAKAAHEQITRMLDSLQPLRTDADPQDCEAYRGLVRDSVRRIVMELGREGGPRVPLVDSAFSVLTGFQPTTTTTSSAPTPGLGKSPKWSTLLTPAFSVGASGRTPVSVSAAVAEIDPDTVPGQLGALRDRFGLDDDHVNTVDEEKQRTSFWTLVELITDLQRSWASRRLDFTLGAGNGFLGTDLVQISRLLAAASEQVDEFEAVLDSVLVSSAERQTVLLDRDTGLTLDDLVQWLRVFFTQDGPNIIRDTGRDGLVSSFTPTAVALLLTLRRHLVRRVVPCGGPSCAAGCHCGSRGQVTCIPLGCCTPLPPGMYAGRVKIAVSTLCALVERLASKAMRIGRFAGAVLLDLAVVPFDGKPPEEPSDPGSTATPVFPRDFVRAEVRGLHLRPTYVPAFVATGGDPRDFGSLVLPLQGSTSADDDTLSGVFQREALPQALRDLLDVSGSRGVLMAASEVPLAIIDGELGRLVQGPAVTTWPRLRPAGVVGGDDGPSDWDDLPANQRFVPQTPPDPVDPEVEEDCLEDYGEDPADCDCDRHVLERAHSGLERVQRVARDQGVRTAARQVQQPLRRASAPGVTPAERLLDFLGDQGITDLVEAALRVDRESTATSGPGLGGEPDDTPGPTATASSTGSGGLGDREERAAASGPLPTGELVGAAEVTDTAPSARFGESAGAEAAGDQEALPSTESEGELSATGRLLDVSTERTAVLEPVTGAEPGPGGEPDDTLGPTATGRSTGSGGLGDLEERVAASGPLPTGELAGVAEVTDTAPSADFGVPAGAEAAGDPEALLSTRSERELSALGALLDLIDEKRGRLEARVREIQDSPQIRRFVVAALREILEARARGNASDSPGKEQ